MELGHPQKIDSVYLNYNFIEDVWIMGLRTELLLSSGGRREGIIITVIGFLLALITMAVIIVIINITSTNNYDFFELVQVAFLNVFIDPDTGGINTDDIFSVLYFSTPLVLTGLAVGIAFRAGLFNIGGQGQMIMGGTFSAIWAAALAPSFIDDPIFMIPTTLFIGLFVGALWGFIPGLLKAYTGAHEVITTIMMNLIAFPISVWLTNVPFLDRTSISAYAQTDLIKESARVPKLFDHDLLNWTIVLVILAVFIIHFVLYKTNLGYKIRAVGLSDTASQAAGINSKRTIIIAMTIAGALAGTAGAIIVMGVTHRWQTGIESTFGFDGIAVSLIGQNSPFPMIFGALLFGLLRQGGLNLQLTVIPPEIVQIFQAMIILFIAAPLIARTVYNLRKKDRNEGKFTSFDLSKWFSQNRGSIYGTSIFIGIGTLLFFTFTFLNIDIFVLLNTVEIIVPLFLTSMPLVAIFVLIMPFSYGIRKIFQSSKRVGKERPVLVTLVYFSVIFIALLEVFILGLYVLNIFFIGFVNPIAFHINVWEEFLRTSTLGRAFVLGIPLMLAAMGGTFNERAGVINIGLEGIMLMSAFAAAYFSFVTGNPFAGLVGGVFAGMMLTLIHAIWSIAFKGEQIVSGVAINLMALGLTDLFLILWDPTRPGFSIPVPKLPKFALSQIPFIGEFLNEFKDFPLFVFISNQSVLLIAGLLLIPICHFLLFHTTFGLRIRFIGEDPQTAATAGISVRLYQYTAVLFSGFLVSLGGVYLSIGDLNQFFSNMTNGAGFIALAAMIVGKWTVIGSAFAGFFFGYFNALIVPLGLLINIGIIGIPTEFFSILPFIIAVLVVSGLIGRARPPKSIGKPYEPSEE